MPGIWLWVRVFIVAALLLVGAAPALAAGDPALLPPDGFSAGWAKEGPPKVYEGEGLYDHIDGGGEPFLELGFEACTVQRYRKGGDLFTLELYRMTDAAAALGIYLTQCGRETPDKGLSERHTVGRNQLMMVKGHYYVVATSPDASAGLPAALVAAAKAAAEGIPTAEPPAVLALLPKEGLVPGSLRILRGPIGLGALVTLGDGDVLLLNRKVTAVAGDYRDKDGATHTLIVAPYPDEAGARAALQNLGAHLDPLLRAEASEPARLLWRDHKGHFGVAYVEGSALRVKTGLSARPTA